VVRRIRHAILVALIVAAVPAPARTATTATLRTVIINSDILERPVSVNVLLPPGYDDPARSHRRYPVLYLLHGAGDTYASWAANTDVEEAAAPFDLIVVMPDAGRGPDAGWYSDWREGPAWETHHIHELIPFIDAGFRTIRSRSARGVAGLSMGGFGAMSYAARHPDVFGVAASFSGAVDTTAGGPGQAVAFEALHGQLGTPDRRVWGDFMTEEVNWRAHNPPDLSSNLRWTRLWLSTGNGVPQPGDRPQDAPTEAGVYALNLGFHRDLDDEGIEHVWVDRGYGTHAWHYWERDLHLALPWLADLLHGGVPAPSRFDYRSAEPSFTVYGWTFATDPRRAQEFLDLFGVSRAGLRLRGSGTVTVTTPPVFRPRAPYSVSGETIVADRDGRLRFVVDLGPPHTARQFSPEGRLAELAGGDRYWSEAAVSITPCWRCSSAATRRSASST
jgi:S-formylglutathione hydrolase FrmB